MEDEKSNKCISEGWLLKSGIWSIKADTNVKPHSKPDHWCEIPFPQSVLR